MPLKPQNLRQDDRSYLLYLPESWKTRVDTPSQECRSSLFTVGFTGRVQVADRELLRQFQEVVQLPDEDKNVVKKLLDAFLTKKHLQALAR